MYQSTNSVHDQGLVHISRIRLRDALIRIGGACDAQNLFVRPERAIDPVRHRADRPVRAAGRPRRGGGALLVGSRRDRPGERRTANGKRRARNRLGFAVQLALVRDLGRTLRVGEELPNAVVDIVADQLAIDPDAFESYGARDETRREHALEIAVLLGLRTIAQRDYRAAIAAGATAAAATERGVPIVTAVLADLKERRILVPAPALIERFALAGRAQARRHAHRELGRGLDDVTQGRLAALLTDRADWDGPSLFGWIGEVPEGPSQKNLVGVVERLQRIRAIGLTDDRRKRIHANRYAMIAREAKVTQARELLRVGETRRAAVLVAFVIERQAALTDLAIEMFDRLIGAAQLQARTKRKARQLERADAMEAFARNHLALCQALANARVLGRPLAHAVERSLGWSGLADAFTHYRTGEVVAEGEPALMGAILADATNTGFERMAESSRGLSLHDLNLVIDRHVRPETYAAAIATLVDAQHAEPLSAVWGPGDTSSSDGQFFPAGGWGEGRAEHNARHGKDPGSVFYGFISDRFASFFSKVIPAAASEAPYVLDGLMHNEAALQIREHATDTAGAVEGIFALFHLFGYRFAPRIRDLNERRLFTIEHKRSYGVLDPMIAGPVNMAVIENNWDELLRLAASIRAGTVPPSVILKKIAAFPRQNALNRALREIGRIERSIFMADWLSEPGLRRRSNANLNKGENRHFLARAVLLQPAR